MTAQGKQCVFCEALLTKDTRSKEHVIPQWLMDFLNIRTQKIQPTHFSTKGGASTRFHTIDGLLAGQICKGCNNGWMSELEIVAMPILKSLILGKSTIVELNENERRILSRWTAKTAFVLNSASNYLKNVPKGHFQHIRLNIDSLPMDVASFGQQHHGERNFFWIQSSTWLLKGNSDSLPELAIELKNKSYKITFQFGKLMLLLSYLPMDNIYPVLWKGIHIPLLPKSGKCGYYEKEDFTWYESDEALNQFHFGLQAVVLE